MKQRKICIVTGTRADYGLLSWLMKSIKKDPGLKLQIIATGMHLSPEFGLTYQEIQEDGFVIDKMFEMLVSGDSPIATTKSTGLGLIGFASSFQELDPDLIILLGDRFEVLAAAISATFARIPIAHIHGGETTEGAFDEAIRHSITKMSWFHFVSTKQYEKRVVQMGEDPERVFNVGALGVEAVKKINLLSKKDLMEKTGIRFKNKNLIITYHPVTLENETSKENIQALLDVLYDLEDIYLIFTMPNADSDNRVIARKINQFVERQNERSIVFTSMGQLNYLSTLQFVDGVIGNSSSGLIEAPSFNIGTVNIGDRQKGRLSSNSVIDCQPNIKSIRSAIKILYSKDFQKALPNYDNIYGDGSTSKKIIDVLKNKKTPKELKKKFYDL